MRGGGGAPVGRVVCHAKDLGSVLKTRGSYGKVVSKGMVCYFCFRRNSMQVPWKARRPTSGLQRQCRCGGCSVQPPVVVYIRAEGQNATAKSKWGCLRPSGSPTEQASWPPVFPKGQWHHHGLITVGSPPRNLLSVAYPCQSCPTESCHHFLARHTTRDARHLFPAALPTAQPVWLPEFPGIPSGQHLHDCGLHRGLPAPAPQQCLLTF